MENELQELSHDPLKTSYLGQVFNGTTNSYKFFWFLGLLNLTQYKTSFSLEESCFEMVYLAWHPVCFFRLSLGKQDNLQNAILEIKQDSKLDAKADKYEIGYFLKCSQEAQFKLSDFSRYVPYRFLTPWFQKDLRSINDNKKNKMIESFATNSQKTSKASPYYFKINNGKKFIVLNESWRTFFLDNRAIIQSFAEYKLTHYLQSRNPNMPVTAFFASLR